MAVDSKLTVGYFSTSRKSGDLRWASRLSSRVSIDAASIVATTDDCNGSSAILIVAWYEANRPRTLETIRWRATNPTVLWDGSISQVPVGMVTSVWETLIKSSSD